MTRRRRGCLAAALATAALAAAAAPALAADPILPLSGVTAGMVGEARTVVRGTQITTFPVRVLDVQQTADGPGGTLILARAEGPLMQQTGGVAQGMSGSPVYVTGADGVPRVIGAIAFGTGDQDNVIVGVTPIEQMLDSSSARRAFSYAPPPLSRAVRRAVVAPTRAAARRLEARDPRRIVLYPLERWTISGASRRVVPPLERELSRSGVVLSSIGPRTPRPPVTLVPGATMSALLIGGDVALGAVGTITYVDGPTILGFGHPFVGAGRSRFLLGDGYVFQTIPAPISGNSYKLAEPGTLQGMIVGDRADGLAATLGPVQGIAAVGTARNITRGTQSAVRATIAPDERTAPIVSGLMQDEPAARVTDGASGGTIILRIAITSPALRAPVTYRNTYAAAGNVAVLASGQVPRLLAILMQNGIQSLPISGIQVDQTIRSQVRAARITGASVRPRRVRPGGRAVLRLALQPWRASRRVVSVPFRVPIGLGSGRAVLRVVPKAPDGFDPLPPNLTQDLGLQVTPAARRAQVARVEGFAARASGTRLARLLTGLSRATDDRHDAVRVLGPLDAAADPSSGVTVPVPYVIYGGRAVARVTFR